jgi:integrase
MTNSIGQQTKVILFPQPKKRSEKSRKSGINCNKEGSVRNINERIYVDFMYLGERVRESAKLKWNENNSKFVRKQLDKIIVDIDSGTFSFAEVFPESMNKDYFQKESNSYSKEVKLRIRFFSRIMFGNGTIYVRLQMEYQPEHWVATKDISKCI